MWTFLLKTSKVKRKGGVWDFDLSPMRMAYVSLILYEDEDEGLNFILFLEALVLIKIYGKG